MSYNLFQALFEARGGSGSEPLAPPLDLASPSFALGELYYSFDVGKSVFVRLGKQLLAWGPSRIWTPVDFVNGQRANFFSLVDLRQGAPGLKLFLPMGKADAMLFADFSDLVSKDLASATVSTAGLDATRIAGRLDATLGGFELGLTGLVASLSQDKAGFDFSGGFFGAGVYGELAYAPAYSSYESALMASLGFSRAIGDLRRWTISAEGFYNFLGSDLTGDAAAISAKAPLYIGAWYGYAAVAAQKLFSPDLATSLSGLANFSDLSYSMRLEEDLSFSRAVPFSLILAFAGGGPGKEFTLLGGDNSSSLSVQTLIEFQELYPCKAEDANIAASDFL